MPGVYRYGINQLEKMLQPLVAKGLQSVLLFGVSQHLEKVIFIKSMKLHYL
jgi:porphobilinogen synthase